MSRFFSGIVAGVAVVAALAGCSVPTMPVVQSDGEAVPSKTFMGPAVSAERAESNFAAVVQRVGPVAERLCKEKGREDRCDFVILVDDRTDQPANAYQTEDAQGRPLILFTLPLIQEARNRDELAFILGHEAAHHIEGHIQRSATNARIGAAVFGGLASVYGYGGSTVQMASDLGAKLGARHYSKNYELAADAMGARIAAEAGYDPVRGAEYFERIPDPGNQFFGTHPANTQRQETVRQAVEDAGSGA